MALSWSSPADIVNGSLARIGFKLRVGSLYDGSVAAKKALDIYGQTRDELLRQDDWGFAERNVALTLQKSAPVGGYVPPNNWNPATNPPIPWLFSYLYPSDCLKVRAVKPTPIFIPPFDPQPFLFDVANDIGGTPPVKVILCNAGNAILVYTGQITDPLSMEADFLEALAAALGRRLTAVLMANLDAVKLEAQDEASGQAVAEMNQG